MGWNRQALERRHAPWILCVIAISALALGCSDPGSSAGTSAGPSSSPTVSSGPSPAAQSPGAGPADPVVVAFIDVVSAADRSMHMDLTGTVTFSGIDQTLTSSFDLQGADYSGTSAVESAVIGAFSTRTIVVGGRTFTNQQNRGWVLEQEPAGPQDPFGGITTADVTYVGSENVHGAPGHRLRIDDPIQAFRRAMGSGFAEGLVGVTVKSATY